MKLFGIVDDRPYHYHLPGCRHEREKVARLLSQAGEVELRIAINPFTASEDKDFCRHGGDPDRAATCSALPGLYRDGGAQ